ncbi:MAG: 16S rRNA (guanine(527)-N(7))-methyltransferase RsmG [Gammaproteobacteria bacterium]|nr:16S rRNA (guanine(527)-N(7))-methyltransferase RsmG [Gammaproteobacteria bacterium]MDH3766828.1 16S rRNA (guanine(527)-N(7))-methyltransferase RsmG [Gammaproteobacteria bacterium]
MKTDALIRLTNGAARLGLSLSEDHAGQMFEYLNLLGEWSRTFNLTSVTDPDEQITHHLLDSLSIRCYLAGDQIVDAGTGAGLPGVPLAIVDPARQFTLVDARAKKTRFLRQVTRTLGLENVEIVTGRLEDYRPHTRFDTVVARALAPLPRLVELTGDLLAPDGILLAMKGRDPVKETHELGEPWGVRDTHRLEVPGLRAERHVVVIVKKLT